MKPPLLPPPAGLGSVAASGESAFIRLTIRRPITIFMAFMAFLVLGMVAYPRIPIQLAPSGLSTGSISVYIRVPDGTPEEVMEEIAKPAEDLLRTVPGVRELHTESESDSCRIRIEFDPEVETSTMGAEVRERMDRAKLKWPEGVDRYHLWRGRMDSDMPIFIVSVGLEVDPEKVDVNSIFENVIQNRLLAIDGVARVEFWGLVEKRVTIALDNDQVAAHGVPVHRLIERLARDNQIITGGKVREGDREYLVRVDGKFKSFDDIREYPVTPGLRLQDIAEVGYYRALRNRFSRVNGLPSQVVVVHKDSIANTIDVCGNVRKLMEEDLPLELPRLFPGIKRLELHPFLNQGEVIRVSIGSLKESAAWGALFAAIVLYLFFRRVRVTLLVTLSIPFSLLITVVWMYFQKSTFNILSMMGMSLGIGMLVDNSIVVVENILRRRAEGQSLLDAAMDGVREIGLAVTLATLTTVVVFLPIMFLGDPRFKAIYQEVGGPLCVSVLASLLVALVFIPQAVIFFHGGSKQGAAGAAADGAGGELASGADRFSLVNRLSNHLLHLTLKHRFEALILFAGILATTWLASLWVQKGETASEGSGRIEFRVELPKNLTLSEANDIFAQLESGFDTRREEFRIRSITSWFDPEGGQLNFYFETGVRVKEDEFYGRVKDLFPAIPGVRVRLGGDVFDPDRRGDRIRVFVRGNDLKTLQELAEMVRSRLLDQERFPELSEVEVVREEALDEVRVAVHREVAQRYGIDARSVSNMVSWAIRGAMLPDFETEDRELPFWIRYRDSDKENIEELGAIPVYRPDGQPVRLENLADYTPQPGPGEINRLNGRMTIAIQATPKTTDMFELKERIGNYFKRQPVPEGFEITMNFRPGGFREDLRNTILAMALALFLVFFVMGLLFESFVLPFSVLLSVPHAFFGALWALFLTGVTLDPMAMVGMVMLVGIVVNNAIVLVDAINRVRHQGLPRTEAILQAARIRFRPIWMTALTTIFGLMPLIILPQRGEGMDYKSMAVVLVGGLTTSTFFTLFVVPLIYTFLDDLRRIGMALFAAPRPASLRSLDDQPHPGRPGRAPR